MKSFLSSTLFVLFCLCTLNCCLGKPLDSTKPVYVTISTSVGDITVLLYDDTPLHRDNFIRLCEEKVHDNVLFHRIIKEFVVQGGDPDSKAREVGVRYGGNNGGYTIPAEILPHYFNKRGALIDAKRADADNPERVSAGAQFCFVQGKIYTDEELEEKEKRINDIRRNWLYYKYKKQLTDEKHSLANAVNEGELHNQIAIMVADSLDLWGPYVIPDEHRQVYKTIGGVPHLDGSVTIFGEVVEGLDIVERLSLVDTDKYDRPLKDVWVKSTKVFQK